LFLVPYDASNWAILGAGMTPDLYFVYTQCSL
jgi:hypothetical protein